MLCTAEGNIASRVAIALGRHHTPVSALCDIADNSISANASKVSILVETESQEGKVGRPKAVLKAFTIVDNGCGMDLNGLDNALSLGSSPQDYHEYTLSKFGMGLKSAAASLGRSLEIITRTSAADAKVYKAVLDSEKITTEYFYEIGEPTDDDLTLLATVAPGSSGTAIRVTSLHQESLPRASEIIEGLRRRARVIYYYYLQGLVPQASKLTLTVNEDAIEPFDPLFVDEIDPESGNLNENTWDGLAPKWIQVPQKVQLDTKGTIFAEVTITQLPHPPSVGRVGDISQTACRERYMTGAGNYGFYVYRNHRLISWADPLGFVSQDQDLYAFRGRFLIDSQADDLLNIDVTKSRIQLSEIATDQLKPLVHEAMKKSKAAWNSAKRNTEAILLRTPHDVANEELDKITKLEDESDKLDETAAPPAEQDKLRQRREEATAEKPTTPEESERLRAEKERVQWVDSLDNNQLWERAHDAEAGLIVRVNSSHRFSRDMLAAVQGDSNLLKVIDVVFFGLARGEYDLVYKGDHDVKLIERLMAEYRERVGGVLSDLIRQLDLSQFLTGA